MFVSKNYHFYSDILIWLTNKNIKEKRPHLATSEFPEDYTLIDN